MIRLVDRSLRAAVPGAPTNVAATGILMTGLERYCAWAEASVQSGSASSRGFLLVPWLLGTLSMLVLTMAYP